MRLIMKLALWTKYLFICVCQDRLLTPFYIQKPILQMAYRRQEQQNYQQERGSRNGSNRNDGDYYNRDRRDKEEFPPSSRSYRGGRFGNLKREEQIDILDFTKHKRSAIEPKQDFAGVNGNADSYPARSQTYKRRPVIRDNEIVNMENLDQQLMDYMQRAKQNGQTTKKRVKDQIKRDQRPNRETKEIIKQKERQDQGSRRVNQRLQQQIIEKVSEEKSKSNQQPFLKKQGYSQVWQDSRQKSNKRQPNLNKRFNGLTENGDASNDSSLWVDENQVILQDLSKADSRLQISGAQNISQSDHNPSYVSSIEAASTLIDHLQTDLSLEGHTIFQQTNNIDKHSEDQEEQREQQNSHSIQQITSKLKALSTNQKQLIQAHLIVKKNIRQFKIKQIELPQLGIHVKLNQDQNRRIIIQHSSAAPQIFQQYIQFQKISQVIPVIYEHQPKTVKLELCTIRMTPPKIVEQQTSLSFIKKTSKENSKQSKPICDWSLIRITRMQLQCMNCQKTNGVAITQTDMAGSLSCHNCSQPMLINVISIAPMN